MTNHVELIQYLIDKFNYQSYLEIGVETGVCLLNINIPVKVGIDPAWGTPAIHLTSDEFFEDNRQIFDIIFIDGWHHAKQFYKDVMNAINCLNDGGIIVCHDCNPSTGAMQIVPRKQLEWTGDVWKGWVQLRQRYQLKMFVLDMDYGCGIICLGWQDPLFVAEPTYSGLVENREKWLNLKPVDYIYNFEC